MFAIDRPWKPNIDDISMESILDLRSELKIFSRGRLNGAKDRLGRGVLRKAC